MRIQSQRNNFGTDGIIWVTNRDPKLDIHGPGSDGGPAFIVTNRVLGIFWIVATIGSRILMIMAMINHINPYLQLHLQLKLF